MVTEMKRYKGKWWKRKGKLYWKYNADIQAWSTYTYGR